MQSHPNRLTERVTVKVIEFYLTLRLLRLPFNSCRFLSFLLNLFSCLLNSGRSDLSFDIIVICWLFNLVIGACGIGAFIKCLCHLRKICRSSNYNIK